MGNKIAFLISILYEQTIVKVGLSIDKKDLSYKAIDYPMEPNSRSEIRSKLPKHVRSMGVIVDVEKIFDVSEYHSDSESCEACRSKLVGDGKLDNEGYTFCDSCHNEMKYSA